MISQDQEWFYKDGNNHSTRVTHQELLQLYKDGAISSETLVASAHGPGIFTRFEDSNAKYQYQKLGKLYAVDSDAELVDLFETGQITNETQIWGQLVPFGGVRFGDLQLVRTKINPTVSVFHSERSSQPTTVLSGPNNSGKSLLLKLLRQESGPASTLLSTNRFYQFDYLNLSTPENWDSKQKQQYRDHIRNILTSNQNSETNDFTLPEVLSRMADNDRKQVFKVSTELLGEEFRIEFLDKQNTEMGPRYIEVGGINLSKTSTGTRLLILLVTALLDKEVSTVMIDEPELGLSPSIQRSLATRLFDPDWRIATFPHLRQIFLSTHSSFFLDRNEITNNFTVTKGATGIEIGQVSDFSEFNNLQFKLLGNDLESIFLPSCVVIVEGPSDFIYFSQLLENSFTNRRISVVKAYGDGGVIERLHLLRDSLGDLQKGPFAQRILIVLDKNHSTSHADIQNFGIQPEHIVILDKNGIEYYYPPEIFSQIFGTTDLKNLILRGSQIELNGIVRKKVELAQEVAKKLTAESQVHEEIKDKILKKIRNILN